MKVLKVGEKYKTKDGSELRIRSELPFVLSVPPRGPYLKVFDAVISRPNEEIHLNYTENGIPLVGKEDFVAMSAEGCAVLAPIEFILRSDTSTQTLTFADLDIGDRFLPKSAVKGKVADDPAIVLFKDSEEWAATAGMPLCGFRIAKDTVVVRLRKAGA